jgi:hypothetical protein
MSGLGRLRTRFAGGPDAAAGGEPEADTQLAPRRDRLIERFSVMQMELGGLFYEMAIRDHIRLEVLIPKAAELQAVDAELGQIERVLRLDAQGAGGNCPHCSQLYARSAAFCSSCGHSLTALPASATA